MADILQIDPMKGATMMNIKKVLILLFLASTLASCTTTNTGNEIRAADGNWGPATSAPQVYMTPNGDRVGHYAPYFYPDGPTGHER
jgi:hypothetical protein